MSNLSTHECATPEDALAFIASLLQQQCRQIAYADNRPQGGRIAISHTIHTKEKETA